MAAKAAALPAQGRKEKHAKEKEGLTWDKKG
jgi:hypothetical protein